MTFRILQNSTTVDASDSNDNFYHVAQGSVLPMVGTSLGNTTGVVDLGSSTYNWNFGYFDSVSADALESDGITYDFMATTELQATATSIEFTGINSDDDYAYLLQYYFINSTSTAISAYIKLNDNLIPTQHLIGSGTAFGLSTSAFFENSVPTTTALYNYGFMEIESLSDSIKNVLYVNCLDAGEQRVGRVAFGGGAITTATVNTVTSIKVDLAAGSLNPGSFVSLYRKGK